jgi:CheY-like chemotaxis protein
LRLAKKVGRGAPQAGTIRARAMANLSGKHVLVVEDETIVAMMLEDMLLDLGAAGVKVAGGVSDALALVESSYFDAAILDLNLRGASSIPVAQALKAKNVPVAFATGYGDAAGAETSGYPVLGKPYSQSDLAAVLQRLLD